MAWINGQWVDDSQMFGGMLGGFGGQPRFEEGYTGDTSLDVIRGPIQSPPFGDRPGMPNLPPQMNPPGYGRGPQMQPPFGGGLGDIASWQPVQTPEFQPLPPGVSVIGEAIGGQPPQMYPPTPTPPRMPAPVPPQFPSLPPQMTFDPPAPPVPPQVRPPMPPPRAPVAPPEIVSPPVRSVLPPITDLIDPVPQDTPTQKELNAADHAFNVAQREKTKTRLAEDRAKTKRHYAKLRAKGASKQTIAKAKAKSKARGAKIKAQHPTRRTIRIDN